MSLCENRGTNFTVDFKSSFHLTTYVEVPSIHTDIEMLRGLPSCRHFPCFCRQSGHVERFLSQNSGEIWLCCYDIFLHSTERVEEIMTMTRASLQAVEKSNVGHEK